MKKIAISSILALSIAYGGATGWLMFNSGLDTNDKNNIDTTLETKSSEEEKFDKVADLISSFVLSQRQIKDKISKSLESKKVKLSKNKRDQYKRILEDLPNNGKYATRDVHRKTHGCYDAEIQFDNDVKSKLNSELAKIISERNPQFQHGKNLIPELIKTDKSLGVFQNGARYNAIVRLSNGHPGNRADRLPDARGFAVKILPSNFSLNTKSAKEINRNTLLDILNINFPTFFVNSASKYFVVNKFFLKSAEDNRSFLSSKASETFSVFAPKWLAGPGLTKLEKVLTLKVNGSVIEHPLYEEYFSMVPSRLGAKGEARAVKYSWVPAACNGGKARNYDYWKRDWTKSHNYLYPSTGFPLIEPDIPPFTYKEFDSYNHYYLRDRVESTLRTDEFCYELHVQLYSDQESTNIEDSMDVWLRSEQEREKWMNDVVDEVGDDNYREKIQNKRIAKNIKIATLKMHKIPMDRKAKNTQQCEDLSFNPWHGNIQYHKPLGQVSRMKQKVYNTVRRHRHQLNDIDSASLERPRLKVK